MNQDLTIRQWGSINTLLLGALRWVRAALLFMLLLLVLKLPLAARDTILLAAAAVLCVLALRHFTAVWLLLLLALPLIHLAASMFDQPKITGLRILLVSLTVAFLFAAKPAGFWRALRRHWAFAGCALFILANLVSALASGQMEAVLRTATYLEPLLFFTLSYYAIRRHPKMISRFTWMVVAGSILVMILGLVEFATQRPLVEVLGIQNVYYELDKLQFYLTEDRFGLGGRISSTLLQPVYAGLYFVVCLVVQVFYLATYVPGQRKWLFLLVPLGLGMVFATGSRGPIFGLLPAALVFMALSRRRGRMLAVVGLAVIAMILMGMFFFPMAKDFLSASLDQSSRESANFFGRYRLTLALLDIFEHNPILGYGPGLIQKAAQQGMGFEGLAGIENQYALILADGGLLAGAAYLLFAGGAIAFAFKLYRQTDREMHNQGLMLLVLFAFYFTVITSVAALTDVATEVIMSLTGAAAAVYDTRVSCCVGSRCVH